MDLYLVNKDSPAAMSIAKKLAEAPQGESCLVKCTEEEMKVLSNNELIKLPSPTDSVVQLFEIDPEKRYLMVIKQGSVTHKALSHLMQSEHFQCRVLFTH